MLSAGRILENVEIAKPYQLGEFVLVGVTPGGVAPGGLATVIGPGAHLRSHTVIYAGNRIGTNFVTGHHALVREANEIGDDVSVGSLSVIEHHVTIGNRVRIHSAAFIPEYTVLEDEAWIGPRAVLTNALHPECVRVKECLKGPVVERGAKIGANATLLPHIRVGRGALVGAGAVVVEDVPAGAVVAGNPARVVKMVSEIRCPFGLVDHPYPEVP